MIVTVNGRKYRIALRGSFTHIKKASEFERILRTSYIKRYGEGSDAGKSLFEMDNFIGMISTSKRIEE